MEEEQANAVLLARTTERENWATENATFFFEYRLLLPDEELLATWHGIFPSQWRALSGSRPALQRRRVDVYAASHQFGEWVFLHVAATVWLLLWESVELGVCPQLEQKVGIGVFRLRPYPVQPLSLLP